MASKDSVLFARFANQKGRITQNVIRYRLFLPPKNLQLSVEAIDGKDCPLIIEAGKRFAAQTTRTLYGWAKLTREMFEKADLEVCVDNDPHCGHATVYGWGNDRNSQLDKGKKLAKAACKCLLPEPIHVDDDS